MKIAYIFEYFGDGGTEENTFLLADQAKKSGYDVVFILNSYSNVGIEKLKKAGFEIFHLSMKSSFNPFSVLRSAFGLKRIIKSESVNIVHAQMLREHSVAIIAKMLGTKFSLIRGFHRLDQFNWKMKPLLPIYLKFSDGIIASSKLMYQRLYENGWNKKIHLVENGVLKVEVENHKNALGFIGRLAAEKGIFEFVKANKDILKTHELVIAGDGPDAEKLKKIVTENKLRVRFIGRISDKPDFYSQISTLILPSETEVLPLVILEAYSCGLPVAAFDIQPLRGLIAKDNGLLVRYPDYEELGKCSLKLLEDSAKYRKSNMGRFEKEFSANIMWKKTNDLYNSVLND